MNETLTVTLVYAAVAALSLVASLLLGRWTIPALHKLKFGQTILDIGPSWHKNKQGTPTMGGLFFIVAMAFMMLAGIVFCETALRLHILTEAAFATQIRFFAGCGLAFGCGIIGFADDYIKVVKKRNLGLTDKQKLFLQLLLSAGYAVTLVLTDADAVFVPFLGTVDLSWWFIPLAMFFIVGMTNATNLTDGVDGLCGSVTFVAALAMLVLAGFAGFSTFGIFAAALAGAVAGYLFYNLHPAKVMMGDTGSLFIGGALCALTFGIGHPLLLIPVGILYIFETISVILQVGYFKLTKGKRLFKMSPIHHHFEMCGWSENKIVAVFSAIDLCGCVLAVLCAVFLW